MQDSGKTKNTAKSEESDDESSNRSQQFSHNQRWKSMVVPDETETIHGTISIRKLRLAWPGWAYKRHRRAAAAVSKQST